MEYLQRFQANTQGRDFVCGDIHGQLQQLESALAAVDFDPAADRLFAAGDLVDRGADSKAVFQLLDRPWFFSIRGNHEALMFEAFHNRDDAEVQRWLNNGGGAWVKNPQQLFDQDPSFAALVEEQSRTLPWAIEVALRDGRRIGLVHACCPCDDWLQLEAVLAGEGIDAGVSRHDAIWSRRGREKEFSGPVANIDLLVHGHCIFKQPLRRHNSCFIDTGAFLESRQLFGLVRKARGKLTLLELSELFALPQLDWPEVRASLPGRR